MFVRKIILKSHWAIITVPKKKMADPAVNILTVASLFSLPFVQ